MKSKIQCIWASIFERFCWVLGSKLGPSWRQVGLKNRWKIDPKRLGRFHIALGAFQEAPERSGNRNCICSTIAKLWDSPSTESLAMIPARSGMTTTTLGATSSRSPAPAPGRMPTIVPCPVILRLTETSVWISAPSGASSTIGVTKKPRYGDTAHLNIWLNNWDKIKWWGSIGSLVLNKKNENIFSLNNVFWKISTHGIISCVISTR
mgnify:CR=1 FL=1